MPTTEERLTDLETITAQLQAQVLSKPSVADVNVYLTAVNTRLDANDSDVNSIESRLGALERFVTNIHSTLSGLNSNGNLLLHNYTATTAPTINDDAGDGYSVGSEWINLTTDAAYKCVDSTVGAAVWSQITA